MSDNRGAGSDGDAVNIANKDPRAKIDPRVLFAAERTLLAWIRTGLSLMGFGFVVARFGLFLRELVAAQRQTVATAPGFSLWIGTALVVLGVVVNVAAVRHHYIVLGRLNRGDPIYANPASPGTWIALTLAVLGIVIALYLFTIGR